MVLLWPVACVTGRSKPSSMPLAFRLSHQHTRRRCGFWIDVKKHRPGEFRPAQNLIPGVGEDLGLPHVALGRAFRHAFQRIVDVPVPVLVIGCDEVGVAEDSVLVDIEHVELLLGLAPDADGGLERREDGQRGEEDEAPCRDYTEGLNTELVETAAVEQAGLADGGEGRGGEQAAGERAPDSAHTVRRDGAERVVDPDPIHVDQGGVHYYAGHAADYDGGPRGDEGAGRGDGDEGRNGAVAAHTYVHVAPVEVAHAHRAEDTGGRGEVRRQGDVGDVGNGGHRRSRVETPPADPEYENAEYGEWHIVAGDSYGAALVVVLAEARTEEQSTGERRHRAREVDHRRAGEVLHPEIGKPAAAPDPMSDHRVDQAGEDDGEDHVDREFGPLQHRAPYDGQRHGAERDLEEKLGRERDLRPGEPRVDIVDLPCRNRQEPALGAYERVTRAEGQREAEGPEQKGGDGQIHQDLRHHAPHVLHPGEPNLQHSESRLHKEDQTRSNDHPHRVHRQREIRRRRALLRERQPG